MNHQTTLRFQAALVQKVAKLHEESFQDPAGLANLGAAFQGSKYAGLQEAAFQGSKYIVSVGDAIDQVCREGDCENMKPLLQLMFLCWNSALAWADSVLNEPVTADLTEQQLLVAKQYVHARNKARRESLYGEVLNVNAEVVVDVIPAPGGGTHQVPMVTGFNIVRGVHGRNASTLISYQNGDVYNSPE